MIDVRSPTNFRRAQIATHALAAILSFVVLGSFLNGSLESTFTVLAISVSGPFEFLFRPAHPVLVVPLLIFFHVLLFRLFLYLRRKWIAWAVLAAFAITWNALVFLYSVFAGIG